MGEIVRRVANDRGLTLEALGKLIHKAKQSVANIYRREYIDIKLLIELSDILDYDFVAHIYKEPLMKRFKEQENAVWYQQIKEGNEKLKKSEKTISDLNKTILDKEKIVTMLDEKINQLKPLKKK